MKEGGEASLGVFPGRCVRSDFAGRGVEIDRGDLVVGDRVWDVGRNVVNEVAEVSVSTLTDDPGGPVELVNSPSPSQKAWVPNARELFWMVALKFA
jgi:hypothetical protein